MSHLLTGAAAGLPAINVFRALANAPSLAPDYMQFFARLFKPLELDAKIERLLVLLIGRMSDCEYVWRQNVIVARSLGVSEAKITALYQGNLKASCFSLAERAAFALAKEVVELVEASDDTFAEAEKYFSPRALTEIIFVIGSYMFLSRLIRTGRIPLDETPVEVSQGSFESARQTMLIEGEGVTLEVYVEGDGPSIVILPSYGRGSGDDFDLFASRLSAAGFRVLRPQPRGIAGSKGEMKGISLHDQANDVALVIRKLGDGQAFLLGHAFGHGVAKAVAADHASLVSGVILAAAQCSSVPAEINRTPHDACNLSAPMEVRLAALRKGFFAPGHDPSMWLDGWYPDTMKMQVQSVRQTDIDDIRNAGSAPVLEIIPEFDPFKPREYWGELRQQLGARVTSVIIPEASHALFPEQPMRVADAVIQWCRAMVPAPALIEAKQ
jgi:pimeloyl-ACP methyl ester carboxylesterase/alkylhydroperoxidase family enzyme